MCVVQGYILWAINKVVKKWSACTGWGKWQIAEPLKRLPRSFTTLLRCKNAYSGGTRQNEKRMTKLWGKSKVIGLRCPYLSILLSSNSESLKTRTSYLAAFTDYFFFLCVNVFHTQFYIWNLPSATTVCFVSLSNVNESSGWFDCCFSTSTTKVYQGGPGIIPATFSHKSASLPFTFTAPALG